MPTTLEAIVSGYQIDDKASMIAELENLIESKDRKIEHLETEVCACHDEIDDLLTNVDELERQINNRVYETYDYSLDRVNIHLENGNLLLTQMFEVLAEVEQKHGAAKIINILESL